MRFTRLCFASLAATMLLASQASAQLDGDGPSPATDFDVVTNFPGGAIPGQGSTFGDPSGGMLNQVNVSAPIDELFLQAQVHFAEFNVSGTGSTGRQTQFFNSEINISSGSLGEVPFFTTNILSEAVFNDSFVSITGGTLGNNATLRSGSTLVLDSGIVGQDIESEVGSTIEVNGGEFSTTRPFVVDGVFNFNDGVVGPSGNFNSNSILTMSGGTLGGLGNPGNSANVFGVANFSGGTIAPRFDAEAGSTVTITGGDFGLEFDAFGTVNISSGTFFTVNLTGGVSLNDSNILTGTSFNAEDGSIVNISGGDFGQFFEAHGGSVVDITGGDFANDFDCQPGCLVTISGGSFGTDFNTRFNSNDGDANVTISGGTFAGFFINQGSNTEISGGDFDTFRNTDSGSVNFTGTEFTVDGVPITDLGTTEINDRNVTLAGVLADGSAFSFELDTTVPANLEGGSGDFFSSAGSVSVTLVPSSVLGDFDGNGVVDCDDLDGYIGNLETAVVAGSPEAALDFNGDGMLTLADANSTITDLVVTSNGITGTFPGDFNCDGTVDVLIDAFALVGNLNGPTSVYSDGDANFDGDVDVLNDAFILVGNLGSTNEAPAAP